MSEVWNKVRTIAETNSGFITTKQIEVSGISRVYLKSFVEKGSLIKVGHGQYVFPDTLTDDYAILQKRSHILLFSHDTALYFWEMSDRIPHTIHVTVPSGTNVSRIKKDNPDVQFHYVDGNRYKIGITETLSPMGNQIKLYDKERCICDLIRNRKNSDMQIYSQAIKDYFKNQPDLRKLLKYGKYFGIEDKIRTYSEVLI